MDDKQAATLLAPFIGTGDVRAWLNAPIVLGGYLIGTNGQLCVCVAGAGAGKEETFVGSSGGALLKILENARSVEWSASLIDVEDVRTDPRIGDDSCSVCSGTGKVAYEDCSDCDGVGEFEHGRHTYTCQECSGVGRIYLRSALEEDKRECPECGGTGKKPNVPSTIKHDESSIGMRNVCKLKTLPECRIDPVIKHGLFWFKFSGGWGCVVPWRH